jgi:methionine-S-sulfoxide reductase
MVKQVLTREIYLAGGCYWGVEKYCSNIRGVLQTEVGFANGLTESPTYAQVCHEHTGHAETVRVVYDPEQLSLSVLLRLFFKIIDPTSLNQQGGDIGTQYRTGIYYQQPEDGEIAKQELQRLSQQIEKPVVVECCPLQQFFPAEEAHQKYLDKNPTGYCHVPFAAMRWVKEIDPQTVEL